MVYKIGVISRSQEFIDLIITLGLNEPVNIVAQQAYFYQAPEVAQQMVKNGVELIISRERTANLLEKSLPIPVIHCDFNAIDILLSLSKAEQNDYPLALAKAELNIRGTAEILGLIERLWNHKVGLISYTDFDDLEKKLQRAVGSGLKGIMGGKLVVEMAAQMGFNKVELFTSQETAKVALERAVLVAQDRRQREIDNFSIPSVLNALDHPMIILDNEGKVKFINHQAEEIIEIEKSRIIDKLIPNFPYLSYVNLLEKGQEIKEKIFTVPQKNQTVLFNLRPLLGDDSVYKGCLVNLRGKSREDLPFKEKQIGLLNQGLKSKYSLDDIVGKSRLLHKAKDRAKEFAKSDFNILIIGETGTGKELFAHAIHQSSLRSKNPFVAINCAALPPNLLESELFGYESGAFTGARKEGKKGLFELAHNGTIFLDEIGEMPPEIQARLLRTLESKEVMHLGGDRLIRVSFRVISTTNINLEKAMERDAFRKDLYYRLSPLILLSPPLRDRREDIPLLLKVFLSNISLTSEKQAEIIECIDKVLIYLTDYTWPGNVRELLNLVERCSVEFNLVKNGLVNISDLLKPGHTLPPEFHQRSDGALIGNLKNIELQAIKATGEKLNWNRKEMADILGIGQSTLWRKLKDFHLERSD